MFLNASSSITSPSGVITTSNVTSFILLSSTVTSEGNRTGLPPSSPPLGLYYFHVIYFSLAIAIGVPGNSVVLAAYGALKNKSSCDWYILYIGLLDLIICLFRVPTHLAMETGQWQQWGTDWLCRWVYWLSQSVISASVILFAFIAVDRYIKVCKPSVVVSPKFSRNSIVLITACSMLFALPTLWMYANSAQGKCVVVPSLMGFAVVRVYYTVLFSIFIAMFVIVVVCYAFIIAKVRKSQRALKHHRKKNSCSLQLRKTHRKIGNNRVGVNDEYTCDAQLGHSSNIAEKGDKAEAAADVSSRAPEKDHLSVIAAHLRDPMKKWSGDYCLLSSRPASTKAVRNTQNKTSPDTDFDLSNETSSETIMTLPHLIPRSPIVGVDFVNMATNTSPWNGPKRDSSTSPSLPRKRDEDCKPLDEGTPMRSIAKNTASAENVGKDIGLTIQSIVEHSPETSTTEILSKAEILDQNLAQQDDKVFDRLHLVQSVTEGASCSCPDVKVFTTEGSAVALKITSPERPCVIPGSNAGPSNDTEYRFIDSAPFSSQIQRTLAYANEAESMGKTRRSLHEQGTSTGADLRATSRDGEVQLCEPSSCTVYTIHREESESNTDATATDDVNETVKVSRSGRSSAQSASRTFRLTLLLLLVTTVFVISWTPPYMAMVWYFYVGYTPPLSSALIALQKYGPTGYVLNHFANPILYLALSPSFRHTAQALWKTIVSKIKRAEDVKEEDTGSQPDRRQRKHTFSLYNTGNFT